MPTPTTTASSATRGLAAARSYSDEIDGVLTALETRLETEADGARDMAVKTIAEFTFNRAMIAVSAHYHRRRDHDVRWCFGPSLFHWAASTGPWPSLPRDARMSNLPPEGRDEFGRLATTLRLLRDGQAERRVARSRCRAPAQHCPDCDRNHSRWLCLIRRRRQAGLVNQRYLEIFPETADLMTPGPASKKSCARKRSVAGPK